MSEYTFDGLEDPAGMPGAGEPGQDPQGPKWFREHMDKVSDQLKELRAENDRLRTERQKAEVENALKAKGYAPGAASLFQGEPNKLDDWLKDHGDALAKLPDGGAEGQQPPAGPPASTVPAEDQQALAAMQQAGTGGVATPLGSDAEQAAQLRNAKTPEELNALLRAQGNLFVQ